MKYVKGDVVLFKALDWDKHQKRRVEADGKEVVQGDSNERLNWLLALEGQSGVVEWADGATYVVRFPTGDLVRLHTSELQGQERTPVEFVQPGLELKAEPGRKTYMEFETRGEAK